MQELIDQIRNECRDGYFAAHHDKIPVFSGDQRESDLVWYSCAPYRHFSKFNYFLPKPLRDFVKDPTSGLVRKLVKDKDGQHFEYNRKKLYLFHYPINYRKVRKTILDVKDNPWAEDKYDVNGFWEKFRGQAVGGSCISATYTRHKGSYTISLPIIVGQNTLLEETMDALKSSPENFFTIYNGLIENSTEGLKEIRDNVEEMHIYDLCRSPKIVKHTF